MSEETPKTGMDEELKLMGQLNRKLETLDDDSRCRVLTWLWDRHMSYHTPATGAAVHTNGCRAVPLTPGA